MILGVDYASARPGGYAIKTAGYHFAVRYLSAGGTSLPGKLLTQLEYTDLQSHGVAVAVNWETTATRMKDGYQAGILDARKADTQVQVVGHPPMLPIYFSADWDATPADQAEIDDYLRGCASVIGPDRVGIYGGYHVVKRCLDNHTATWAWQTAAWSGGNREPRAHLYQRVGIVTVNGVECDVNEAIQSNFGQHPAVTSGPISGPESIPFMEYGQTSDVIRRLQSWLNSMFASYSRISPVSGYYGDQTTAVIREFQKRVGIVGGDGRNVGVQTRSKLYEHGFRG